jgi:hypothetical protein
MEADSDRQNVRKILKEVTISGSASSNPMYCESQLFQKFKYENVIKMKNKPEPALLGGSYLFNKIKKRTLKSCETIPLNIYCRYCCYLEEKYYFKAGRPYGGLHQPHCTKIN